MEARCLTEGAGSIVLVLGARKVWNKGLWRVIMSSAFCSPTYVVFKRNCLQRTCRVIFIDQRNLKWDDLGQEHP